MPNKIFHFHIYEEIPDDDCLNIIANDVDVVMTQSGECMRIMPNDVDVNTTPSDEGAKI
jgi:hypothetical protein